MSKNMMLIAYAYHNDAITAVYCVDTEFAKFTSNDIIMRSVQTILLLLFFVFPKTTKIFLDQLYLRLFLSLANLNCCGLKYSNADGILMLE